MAYAALSSLMNTLQQLLKPNQSFVCQSCTQQHLQSIYQNLSALQLFLDDTTKDIVTLKVIEKRIRDVVYKAENRVDSSLRMIIVADREDKRQKACRSFYEELLKVEQQVYFLNKEVMLIEFNKLGSRSEELATNPFSPEKIRIEENTVVGMEDDFNTILDRITAQTDELTVIPIFGMGGIGTCIPWEVMNLLANLPNLEVLQGYSAFAGTDWRLNEDVVFRKLKHLLLYECKDLQRWEAAGSDNFPMLEQLILRGFSQLEEIPESVGEIMTLKLIKIEWCSSGVNTSAKKIQEEQESWGNDELQVQITSEMERLLQKIRTVTIHYKKTDILLRNWL